MSQQQQAYLIGRLWQEGRKPSFIDYELMMIDRNRNGELSDITTMIMTDKIFLSLDHKY